MLSVIGSNMKKNLYYRAKNIPVPSKKLYKQILISTVRKFIHNARWKATFFLKQMKPRHKNTYKYKSTNPLIFVNKIRHFEVRIAKLEKNVKYKQKVNDFQRGLNKDTQRIKSDKRVMNRGTNPQIFTIWNVGNTKNKLG